MIPLVKGDKIEPLFMHAWVAKTFFKIIKPFTISRNNLPEVF